MEYVNWFLVSDVHEWEAIGGQPADLPDEFPVLALHVEGYIVTVNYDTAKLLTDAYEDGEASIAWTAEDDGGTGDLH